MHRMTVPRFMAAALAALATSAVLAQGIFVAPPPPRVEAMPSPRAGYVWDPGHWQWVRGRYVWVGGHWRRARPGFRWVPGHWVPHGRSWRWVLGHWA